MPERHDDPELVLRLLDDSPGLVLLVDDQLVFRWVNRTAAAAFGWTPEEMIGTNVLDHLDLTWSDEAIDSIGTAMGGEGLRKPMLFRARSRDGSHQIMEVTANVLYHDPVVRGMVCYVRPWTERYLLDQALEATAARRPIDESLRLLVDIAGADTLEASVAFVFDPSGECFESVVATPGLSSILCGPSVGSDPAVLAGWADLLGAGGGGDVVAVADLAPELRKEAEAAGFRTLWLWPSEHVVDRVPSAWALAWRTEDHLDVDQTRRQMMARLANLAGLIVDRARSEEATLFAATHDALTGLANRAAFYDDLDARLGDPTGAPVAVAYLDLDGFKPVNDRLGHGVGDEVLAVIGRRLAAAVPEDATAARLGGDEFAVSCTVAEGDPREQALAVAEHLVAVVSAPVGADEVDAGEDTPLVVGVSVGVSIGRPGEVSADGLVEGADQALYLAKGSGGRCVRIQPLG